MLGCPKIQDNIVFDFSRRDPSVVFASLLEPFNIFINLVSIPDILDDPLHILNMEVNSTN